MFLVKKRQDKSGGGGGAGYYGGGAGNYANNYTNRPGGGGSGYINGVTNGYTQQGRPSTAPPNSIASEWSNVLAVLGVSQTAVVILAL